ncbi:MAG: hypothetical protein OEM38_12340 [Gammaproteobacteria bacterium]|nr:hypothetical protein [Gammaproteobacteria bacterium]
MDNKELVDVTLDDEDVSLFQSKAPINLDARRRLEEYREQRELERLLKDEFDY